MANLRTAMDAAFWDMNISTPQALDGASKAVTGDPIPIEGGRASKALSIQQLSLLGIGFLLRRITIGAGTTIEDCSLLSQLSRGGCVHR
ncbi:hypothetical protein ABFS83_10G114400 [Erythranthe nasuta]